MLEIFLLVFLVLADWGMVAIARNAIYLLLIVLARQAFKEL
ncbi:hypothetical protein QUA24_25225 [Microcoleus sp. Pol12B5]